MTKLVNVTMALILGLAIIAVFTNFIVPGSWVVQPIAVSADADDRDYRDDRNYDNHDHRDDRDDDRDEDREEDREDDREEVGHCQEGGQEC